MRGKSHFFLAATLLAAPAAAVEGTRPAYTPPPSIVSSGSIMQIIFSLLLVLAAVALVAWLLKRMNVVQQGSGSLLKVLGGVAIGQRERIVLVEINDTWLVVGVGAGQVRTLHTLEKPEASEQNAAGASHPIGKPLNFSAALSSALGSLSHGKRKQQPGTEAALTDANVTPAQADDRSRHAP